MSQTNFTQSGSKTIKVWDDDREKILKKYKDV